jgi:vacuolar-type H+-ATPase subunit E/Vma4
MRQREKTIGAILEKVERELAALVDTPRYREILIDWIAEAAVGLGAKQARVNAPEQERRMIDKDALKQAARAASSVLGHDVALELDDASPLAAQGVVVTAHDGRTAYNNQVKTRLLRRQSEIRNLIHDELYGEKPSG